MPSWKQDIQTFKKAFDGGTRPNRFIVTGDIGGRTSESINHLLVKAASVPAQTLGIIQVPFRGRIAKLPGDRVYAEWTFTVLDTNQAHGTRRKFENWHQMFNFHFHNVADDGTILDGIKENYYTDWTVGQLDSQGTEIPGRAIKMVNCWPVEVGAIDLSYDTADTLTEYSITLAYDYLLLIDQTGASQPTEMEHTEGAGAPNSPSS